MYFLVTLKFEKKNRLYQAVKLQTMLIRTFILLFGYR